MEKGEWLSIFKVAGLAVPYSGFRFPGQHQDERIFYATRAAKVILWWRWMLVTAVFGLLMSGSVIILTWGAELGRKMGVIREIGGIGGVLGALGIIGYLAALWWMFVTWKKTVFLVTNKRLTQFVFTTPWTHYQLSLSLDKVVDTAATTSSYLQRLLGVGSLFARSAAGAEGDFLVANIQYTKDLHNWLTKLVYEWETASKKGEALIDFKPFVGDWKVKEV